MVVHPGWLRAELLCAIARQLLAPLIGIVTGTRIDAVLLACRRGMRALAIVWLTLTLAFPSAASAAPDPRKVLRYAFPVAETGFDPSQVEDLYSVNIIAAIFDPPLTYDYLARPLKLVPNTLVSLPEVSADNFTYTLRVMPGIYFADDSAFNGVKRELIAADYAYSIKRHFDPKVRSKHVGTFEGLIVGMDKMGAAAKATGRFDYDRIVEGLQVLDRYTLQIKLQRLAPNFMFMMANTTWMAAVAREVVERYAGQIMEHPVGTGPYRLKSWTRSSKIVLEANPTFREVVWAAQPAADDVAGQAMLRRNQGRRLPLIGKIEINIIEEIQPRWLAFLNDEHDFIDRLPNEYANIAIPENQLAPNLAKRGIQMQQALNSELVLSFFNMDDPVVGGYAPHKVALRRAISMAYSNEQEIRVIRKNQAIPAHQPIGPGATGYDPDFRTVVAEYNLPSAKALLDTFGYVDRDGDGYREQPDGQPLVIEFATQPDSLSRQYNELWQKSMDALGIRLKFRIAKWPDNLKAANAGKLQIWQFADSAVIPDADSWLYQYYGPNEGDKGNLPRFKNANFDRLYEKYRATPHGPERQALVREMVRIIMTFVPVKVHVHRIETDMLHPWVQNYRRHPMLRSTWKYMDIDIEGRK